MFPGGVHIIFPTPSSSNLHVIAGTVSSGGSHSHETLPLADERLLVASGRWLSLLNPPVSGLCTGNQVVTRWGQIDERGSSLHSALVPVLIYRCVPVGVGSSSSGPHSIRSVVRWRVPGAHQHPGDVGRRTGPSIISHPASQTGCRPDERQHISCSLPPASGWHSTPPFMPDGLCHQRLGGKPLNSSGGTVRSRQKKKKKKKNPSRSVKLSRSGPSNRAVTAAPCVRWDLPAVRMTSPGPIYHSGKQHTASLCFHDARSASLEIRCSTPSLDHLDAYAFPQFALLR